MSTDRFADILKARERDIIDARNRAMAREEWRRGEDQFYKDWCLAYGKFNSMSKDEGIRLRATQNLIRLSIPLKQRFWDFRIAELLADTQTYGPFALAGMILGNACAADELQLLSRLEAAGDSIQSIVSAHHDLFEILKGKDSTGLPFTPPVLQHQLARLAGVSYDKVRSDIKAKRWERQEPDSGRHLRRWRHIDSKVHAAVLIKFREDLPEKIWSKIT